MTNTNHTTLLAILLLAFVTVAPGCKANIIGANGEQRAQVLLVVFAI